MTVHTEIQDSQTVTTRASEALCDDALPAKIPPGVSDNLVRTNSYARIIRPSWRCSSDTDSDSESSGSASTDTHGRRRFYRRRRRPVAVAKPQPIIELEVDGCGGLKALLELELAVKHDHYQHSVSSLSSFYDSDSDESPVVFFQREHLEILHERLPPNQVSPHR